VGNSWLNVPKGVEMSLASRRGKVTVVHFWTFGCINCQRNLPAYANWRKWFASRGLEIIGVHTPETEAERDAANVAKKVKELGIEYPVLLDPGAENWQRWQQRVWPAVYLIDKQGRARLAWEGELEYQGAGGGAKMSAMIEQLLRE
jgi:peroxiredoxin